MNFNFISTFEELNKLYESASALHEEYTVKYGRGGESKKFDSLEAAVEHINTGMKNREHDSFVLYHDNNELIWLDWYTANRDSSDSNWSEARKASKAPVSFDKKEGKLSIIADALTEGDDYWRDRSYYDQSQKDRGVIKGYQKPAGYNGSQADWTAKCRDSQETNRQLRRNAWESLDEDAEIEIVDDEPKQVIIECSKCGALVIIDESDLEIEEESELVNVDTECKFCEEKDGYTIVGTLLPYEVAEINTEEEPVADEVEDTDTAAEDDAEVAEDDIIEEDLADIARKVLDKPASTKTQQRWEAELNGEMGDISDKRRKHLERKFQQQRDWEARHTDSDQLKNEELDADEDAEDLDELFDIKPGINLSLDGGQGNDVSVLGTGV